MAYQKYKDIPNRREPLAGRDHIQHIENALEGVVPGPGEVIVGTTDGPVATPVAEIGGGVAANERYLRGGELLPVHANRRRVVVWGSSSANRMSGPLASEFGPLNVSVVNQAKEGERSLHTAARLGAIPAKLSFPSDTIPASGSATVTIEELAPGGSALRTYSGTVAGVPGTLAWNGTGFSFTRTTDGSAVTVTPDVPMLPTRGQEYRDAVTLLWAGKNDLTGGVSATEVIARIDEMFTWLAPLYPRTLVLGHFVNRDTAADAPERTAINAVNAAHAAHYGDLYVDVAAFVTSEAVWAATGITPTADDLEQQERGSVPGSLADAAGSHLNAAGYTAVAELVRERMEALGWYTGPLPEPVVPTVPPLLSDNFSGGDAANIVGRATNSYAGGTATVWEGVNDNNGTTLAIVNGQLTRPAPGTSIWGVGVKAPKADYEVSFDLIAPPLGTAAWFDIRRGTAGGGGADGYRLMLNVDGTMQVQRRTGGTLTSISGVIAGVVGKRIGLGARGSTVYALIDDVVVWSGTDDAVTGAGWASFSSNGTSYGFVVDNLVMRDARDIA